MIPTTRGHTSASSARPRSMERAGCSPMRRLYSKSGRVSGSPVTVGLAHSNCGFAMRAQTTLHRCLSRFSHHAKAPAKTALASNSQPNCALRDCARVTVLGMRLNLDPLAAPPTISMQDPSSYEREFNSCLLIAVGLSDLLKPVFHPKAGDPVEIAAVARHEGESAIRRNTRQPDVLHGKVLTSCDRRGHHIRRRHRVLNCERQSLEPSHDVSFDAGPKRRWAGGSGCSESQFKNADCAQIESCRRLTIQAGQDPSIRDSLHQLADDVGVEQKHGGLPEVHRRLRYPSTAERADIVQRGEEWIVSLKGVGNLAGRSGLAVGDRRSLNRAAKRFLEQHGERPALLPGPSLGFAQQRLVDIDGCLHAVKVTAAPERVNRAKNVRPG